MPHLRHVVVSECSTPVYYWANHWLRLPNDSARWYGTYNMEGWDDVFHQEDRTSAEHIYVGTCRLLGCSANLCSASIMAFCEAPETLGHILQSSISLQDVQSLTVAKGFHQVGGGQPAPWHALFRKMKALSTRIFGHGIPDWASHIGSASGLIPYLTEVRISQYTLARRAEDRFLVAAPQQS